MKFDIIHLKDFYPFLGEDGRDPQLSLYLPDNLPEMQRADAKRKNILICPGGGYNMCSTREAEPIAFHFLPEGFNVFVLWYSCVPHRFPTQLIEVAAAMDLIHKKTEEWHTDTEKIAIMGFSAGAHLAAHYTNAYKFEEVREIFPESKPVNATVLSYPVITTDDIAGFQGTFESLMGKEELTEEEKQKISCEKLVSDSTPPTFIWHTSSDAGVPVVNSLLYAKALWEHHIPVEMHIYPYGYHGLATADYATNNEVTNEVSYAHDWLSSVKKWFDSVF